MPSFVFSIFLLDRHSVMHAAYCSAKDSNYCMSLKMGKENNMNPAYIFYLSCYLHDRVIKYKDDLKT